MGLENTPQSGPQDPESGLQNKQPPRRQGRTAVTVPPAYATVLDDYLTALAHAPVTDATRRTYASKVRQFLVWLATADTSGDPLTQQRARDGAARDYRTHLLAVTKRKPATVNNALAAVDDFYTRRGLGPANAARAELPKTAPRALGHRPAVKFLREVENRASPRDKAVARGVPL